MLAVCQLGITVCSLLILNVAEPAIHHLFAGRWSRSASRWRWRIRRRLSSPCSSSPPCDVREMVPKNISVSVVDKAVLLLAPPLIGLSVSCTRPR
ncbi:hypothetical protein [Arthrobacter sp.]|uniref:hypothetical protein n=1 Tax=Arthrobacter sp. TaxID=1667 RepID=UPI003A8DC987